MPTRYALLLLVCAALAASPPARADEPAALGPLPDIAQGSASAPVTVIEYASMTCTHCAAFHESVWPAVKRYVDAGRVRFILREFPLDPLATAAFMLARCAGPDKRDRVIDAMFARQKSWAFVDKPSEPLLAVVREFGFSQADFETCLGSKGLYQQVNAARAQAEKDLGVMATPTFFLNGRRLSGELTRAEWEQAIESAAR